MPRYRIRMDDPDTGEFRVYVTHADTEQEALQVVLESEAKKVAFRMDAEELAKVTALAKDGDRAAAGRVHMHNQAQPYTITSVREG